jgi:aspartate racemase
MAQKKLGILGGLGPLASLAFLSTIYECNRSGSIEQDYPDIILHSLSSMPDRTRSLLSSDEDTLAAPLIRNLRTLNACGVAKIVICCFTSHALIHRLPPEIRAKVVSLVDLAAQELITRRQPSLLLASLGSYQKNVFTSTVDALKGMQYIVLPDEKDKTRIHGLIYDYLKPGKDVAPVYSAVKELLDQYAVTSFIAGCTEFHLLSRYIQANGIPGISFIDPLISIARRMDQMLSMPIHMDLHPVMAEAQIV